MTESDVHLLDRRAERLAADAEGSPDEYLTTRQVADLLAVSVSWLEIGRMKSRNYGPPATTLGNGRLVRYRRSDLLRWLAERAAASQRRQVKRRRLTTT